MKFKTSAIVSSVTLIMLCSIGITTAQTKCFRVGLNIGTSDMFINRFTHCRMYSPKQDEIACDPQGYPLEVPSKNTKTGDSIDIVTYLISNYPSDALHNDSVYVLRWDGEGEFQVDTWLHGGVETVNCTSPDPRERSCYPVRSNNGRLEFRVDNLERDEKFRNIHFKLKKSSKGNHVRNVRLYLKSFETAYENQGERFNPLHLEKLESFYMLRFMGAFRTNNSPFRSWEDRTPKDFWNQSRGPHGSGLAYEWAIELCNRTGKHMWFNVPHAANEYAIRQMAELVRDNLDPNLMVYLEYSNETWNWAGPYRDQFDYVQAEGGMDEGHIKLTKVVFDKWHEVFGRERHRIKRVMPGYWRGRNRLGKADPEDYDVYSPTYYWGARGEDKENWDQNTTVEEMLESMRKNIRGGRWYEKKKHDAELARLYNKELYCYEGGMGGDPGDSVPHYKWKNDYPYWRNYRKLQKDPRLVPIIHELVDSLTSLGYEGGNELGLTGSWDYNPIAKFVSFWGMINSLYDTEDDFPKFKGMMDKVQDCDRLIKESDTIGAGMAIRLDGTDDYIVAPGAYKPNDITTNYTIEFWMRPELMGFGQYLVHLSRGNGNAANNIFLGADNRIHWNVTNNSGGQVVDLTSSPLQINRYHHIAAVKNGSTYKLYVNGSEKGMKTGALSGDCSRNQLVLGAKMNGTAPSDFYRGRLDEFRMWNTPLTVLTIRSWMCKKVTASHPSYANLQNLYRFDVVETGIGEVKDSKGNTPAQLKNVTFSHFSNYKKSGAPIGDDSKHLYPPSWNNASLSIAHANGDNLAVINIGSGTPEGVHVYRIDQKPNNTTLPSAGYTTMGSYYYGVFMANGTDAGYQVVYNYSGNPIGNDDAKNRLLRRNDNADLYNWRNTGAQPNASTHTLTTAAENEKDCGEYILAVRNTTLQNMSGPGYALKFNGGETTAAELSPYFRPDEEYTVSAWVMGRGDIIRFTSENESGGSNTTLLEIWSGKYSLRFSTGSIAERVVGNGEYLIDKHGWNHVALVKKNNQISLYLNGILHPSIRTIDLGVREDGSPKDEGFMKMHIGERFNGYIDEVRVWNKALPEKTIRDWMCRSVTSDHPLEADHLVTYFKFDEGQGRMLENTRGPGELTLKGNIEWVFSGAPIGDTTSYVYNSDVVSLAHPDGDHCTVDLDEEWSQDYQGIHIYRVDNKPANSTFPANARSLDTTRYWGVFVVPYCKQTIVRKYRYNIAYNYNNNPNIANENNIRLLSRKNNAERNWHLHTSGLNTSANTITITVETPLECDDAKPCSSPREILLGGTTQDAIQIDNSTPRTPGEITGKSPVCAGETGVVYRVNSVPDADYYVWELPDGMAGYSGTDTIVVSVEAGKSGAIGDIKVKAGNRWGESDWSTKAISAQATPSMSVDISGPNEVCQNQQGIRYTIASVNGAAGYVWEATNGTSITGNGTSAQATFGNRNTNITIYGQFGCGRTVLNTKTVTVNKTPSVTLEVTGNRVCQGCEEYALVTIPHSESGVEYRAYKSAGTAPIGIPVTGTGSGIRFELPVNELRPGENVITIKAQAGECQQVTLNNRASVIIDVIPPEDLEISLENGPLCPGDTAVILIKDSPPGVRYYAFGSYDWTIDSKGTYEIEQSVTSQGGDTRVYIPPARSNMQMAGDGVGLGNNKVWFDATLGSCPKIHLKDTVRFFIGNEPHFLAWKDFDYWKVPVPPEDTIDVQISAAEICSNEPFTVTVNNAQQGIRYAAFLLSNGNSRGAKVKAISDTVRCTSNGQRITLNIPPYSLEGGLEQVVGVEALGTPCNVILGRSQKIDVYGEPDKTLPVSDYTVCRTGDAIVTLSSSQEDILYRARLPGSSYETGTKSGNGGDLTFTIPNSQLSLGINRVVIDATSGKCANITLEDTSNVYSVEDLKANLGTKGNYATLCIGVDAEITVYNPEPGVTYTPYRESTVMGDPVVAKGDSVVVIVPANRLSNLAPGDVTITIEAAAGSCETNLNNTITFSILNKAYPEGGITVFDMETQMCPDREVIGVSEGNYDNGGAWWPMYIQGRVENTLVGSPVLVDTSHQSNREPNISIRFPRDELPAGDTVDIGFVAKMDGCPPKKLDFGCWRCRFTSDRQPTYIVPDYNLGLEIRPDTVCLGEIGTITIIDPEGADGGTFIYRGYDPVSDLEIASAKRVTWRIERTSGNLELPMFDPGILKPGPNEFDVQVQGGDCGWMTLHNKAVIYVNEAPIDTMTVTGKSICAGDGSIEVANTQPNVYYQAYLGNTGVSESVKGNGGSITIPVAQKWLSTGTNELSVRAAIPGCVNSTLRQRALIDVTDQPPAKPGPIQGETEFCGNANDIQYSVAFDQAASSYTWNLPPGASTDAISNIALVDFGTTGGNITVTANNVCGSSQQSDPLNVTVTPMAQGGTVIGPDTTVCSGSEVALKLTGHTGAVTKWQWSEEAGVWNDIIRADSALNHTVGNNSVTFRAVVGDGSCGQGYSSTHTVQTKTCSHIPLAVPVPTPRGNPDGDNSYSQKELTVTFEPSGQDSVRDIYYVVCTDFTRCSMDSAKVYDPTQGIVLDIFSGGHKNIRFQARPKPGKESGYLPSSIDSAIYIYSKHQLGVPVPNPGSGTFDDTSVIKIIFEKTDQSSYREIYYTVCDDTIGCELTQSNRQLYDTATGIVLDIASGKKGVVFQAVPIDPTAYEASVIGKVLYIYKPGIAPEQAAYFDTDADGRIDRAKITFKKDMPKLPESITLYAPYDKSESVVVTPQQLSRRSVVLDFPDKEFSRQVTGFATGEYGKVNDTEGFFNTDPFNIADSVAPVILSAVYTMTGEPDGVSYMDTLVVTFSEGIIQSGTAPFVYIGTNTPITLTQIGVQGNVLRAIVPVDASDKSNTLQPGDSIAIRTSAAGNNIGDTKGMIQSNPDNIRVPVKIVPPADFFRMRSGPTLFDPSRRQFMVNLAPNERISVLDHESKGTMTIYDGVGNVVLSEPLEQKQNSLQYIWTGHNHNKRLVGQGTYVAVIEFTISGMSAREKIKIGVKR